MTKSKELTPKQDLYNCKLALGTVSTMRDLYLLTVRKCGMLQAPEPTIPKWASNCFDGIWQASYSSAPEIILPFSDDLREQGALAGFILWWQNHLKSTDELFSKLGQHSPIVLSKHSQRKVDEASEKVFLIKDLVTEKDLAEADALGDATPDFSKILSTGTAIERIRFSEGLTMGLKGPSQTDDSKLKETDATEIYILLFLFWRQIIEFKSVTQLHHVLCLLMGKNRVGEKKRVETICRRIGLRLRGRGRPIKSVRRVKG